MTEAREHSYIPKLKELLAEGKVDRREFLRTSTLLGLSASAAYAFVGKVTGQSFVARAQAAMPRGGTIRIGMRVGQLADPHGLIWIPWSNIIRQVVEYLTITDQDNITKPYLLERWEVSEDLRSWTMHIRREARFHDGRPFTADDAIWNIKRVLTPEIGSAGLGLMKAYMLEEYETGEVDEDGNPVKSTRLWDANALEKINDQSFRINCKVPQLAVPEHLFQYTSGMIDPEDEHKFRPGMNATGPFEIVEYTMDQKAVLRARDDYWGRRAYLDELVFIDVGDDPSTAIGALASKQVHGLDSINLVQLDAVKAISHVDIYPATTASTVIARVKVTRPPFDDPRVRKALRLATNSEDVVQLMFRGLGTPGEHHHVSPIHPEYAKLPFMKKDVEAAKGLLAEAGFPDGLDVELNLMNDAEDVTLAQALVEQWKDAGIRATLKVFPSTLYWEGWDKTTLGLTGWNHRPLGIMILGLAYRSGVPWNESEFNNPEFDRLLTEAEGTVDVNKRREIMAKIETIMQEEGPLVQPYWKPQMGAFDKRVKGFVMHPTTYIFGWELAIES